MIGAFAASLALFVQGLTGRVVGFSAPGTPNPPLKPTGAIFIIRSGSAQRQTGGGMSTMADETLAFSVAEATMQEWLAATLLARPEPMTPRPQQLSPHPVYVRQAFVRPVTRPAPVRPSARPVAERNGLVAGARTVYWLSLAAALAVTLIF